MERKLKPRCVFVCAALSCCPLANSLYTTCLEALEDGHPPQRLQEPAVHRAEEHRAERHTVVICVWGNDLVGLCMSE